MARISKGILGGVSGKIGNVVGGNWKGIDYLRSLPASVANPRTPAQQYVRMRFATVIAFLRPLREFLRIGYSSYAVKMTALNAATSYLMRNALTGSFPDVVVDLEKVKVSRGNLRATSQAMVASPAPAQIELQWIDESDLSAASPTDQAFVVIVNPARADVQYRMEAAPRSAEQAVINLPAAYTGDEVHVYLGFSALSELVATGARNNISDSVYAGSVVVA